MIAEETEIALHGRAPWGQLDIGKNTQALNFNNFIRYQCEDIIDAALRKVDNIVKKLEEQGIAAINSPGIGFESSHWGEICQGPLDYNGHTITALISLPRRDLWTIAVFQPLSGRDVNVEPTYAEKAARAVRIALDAGGMPNIGGYLELICNIKTVGCGAGSSTCNVVAAVRSVNDAFEIGFSDADIQKITQWVEGASDPLALISGGTVAIYGSRSGDIVERIEKSLPPMACLGFITSPGKTVLTESLIGNEQYTSTDSYEFKKILTMAVTAIQSQRLDLLAKAATESGRLNQKNVPISKYDDICISATENGALGVAVSHSGTVCAALFDPTNPCLWDKMKSLAEELKSLGCIDFQPFTPTANRKTFV